MSILDKGYLMAVILTVLASITQIMGFVILPLIAWTLVIIFYVFIFAKRL